MTGDARSLSALLQRVNIEDHEEILRACNASLKQSKKDLRSLHAKVVALLKLDRYEDALHVLEDGGEALENEARLERSYALYKTGQLLEAEKVAKGIDNDRGARHVEAQAVCVHRTALILRARTDYEPQLYRSQDFENSALLYRDLSTSHAPIDNEENDLRINSGATDAQLEWIRQGHLVQKKKPGREDLEAFELAYNAACVSIARGELAQGEVLLRRSQGLFPTEGPYHLGLRS